VRKDAKKYAVQESDTTMVRRDIKLVNKKKLLKNKVSEKVRKIRRRNRKPV